MEKGGFAVTRLDVLCRAGAAAAGVVFAPVLARLPVPAVADMAVVERRADAQAVAQFRAFQRGYADAMRRALEERGCLRSGEARWRLAALEEASA